MVRNMTDNFLKNSPAFSQIYMQYGLNSRASLTKISLFAFRTTFFACAIQPYCNSLNDGALIYCNPSPHTEICFTRKDVFTDLY